MDWTATAFGLLVTVVGALFAAVVLLVRRELDHTKQQIERIDERLRKLEADQFFLRPVADGMQRKLEEGAASILTQVPRASNP